MIESFTKLDRDMTDIAELVPVNRLAEVAGQVLCAPLEAADRFADALWTRLSGDPRVIALAIRLAPALEPERTLEWSARLRSAGYADRCPLITGARDTTRPAGRRVLNAALAHAAFADERAGDALMAAAAVITEDDMVPALVQLDDLDPALLPRFIEGAMTSGDRVVAIADALTRLGAEEQADAVRAFGTERFGPLAAAAATH
jgi:hypothetical protein